MRHLPLCLLLTATTGYTLPALANSEAAPDDTPAVVTAATIVEVKVAVIGRIDLTADQGRKVFIKFLTSPKLTAIAWASLASGGFELVDTREQADVVYELDSISQALRPVTQRTAEVRVGDYAESPIPLIIKSGQGGSMVLSLNPLAMLIGTIVSNVRNATGVQDSVNTATAGDPDGKCLPRCEMRRYRQRNVVSLTHREGSTERKCSILVTAEDAKLVPTRLIQSSLAGL